MQTQPQPQLATVVLRHAPPRWTLAHHAARWCLVTSNHMAHQGAPRFIVHAACCINSPSAPWRTNQRQRNTGATWRNIARHGAPHKKAAHHGAMLGAPWRADSRPDALFKRQNPTPLVVGQAARHSCAYLTILLVLAWRIRQLLQKSRIVIVS
jgi:hypothetical protein